MYGLLSQNHLKQKDIPIVNSLKYLKYLNNNVKSCRFFKSNQKKGTKFVLIRYPKPPYYSQEKFVVVKIIINRKKPIIRSDYQSDHDLFWTCPGHNRS